MREKIDDRDKIREITDIFREAVWIARKKEPFYKKKGLKDPQVLTLGLVRLFLEEVLLSRYAGKGLEFLYQKGILAQFLPEIVKMVNFKDEGVHHKDIWEHTKIVIQRSPFRSAVRWAALFHDIGKPNTRSVTEDGEVYFIGHQWVGANIFKKIAERFEFPEELKVRVHFLILHHLRASQYTPEWADFAVRRFIRDIGIYLDDLFALSRADITTRHIARRKQGIKLLEEFKKRIEIIREIDSKPPPLPKGMGNYIMKHFNLEPGPKIGSLRRILEQAVEAGRLKPQKDPQYYLSYLEQYLTSLKTNGTK